MCIRSCGLWECNRGMPQSSVQVWSVYMQFNVKGFKIITLHSNFQTFLQHFTKKIWYWSFCIEYENNMMSHHIEEVLAIKWCTVSIWIPYIMRLIVIQLQRQNSLVFSWFSSVKNYSAIHIFLHYEGWKLCRAHFLKCPTPQIIIK